MTTSQPPELADPIVIDLENEAELYKKHYASALEMIQKLETALKFYTQTRRDTSFIGWEKEWRHIEATHDSDYEYYPNHDVATEAIKELKMWRGGK
jgi:hypothetical protein